MKPFASSFVPLVYSDSRNAAMIGYSTTRASTSSVGESRTAASRAVPSLNRRGRFRSFSFSLVLTGAVSATSGLLQLPGQLGYGQIGAGAQRDRHAPAPRVRSLSDERVQLGL